MKNISLLSGGAAQGLVTQLEHRFETEHRCSIDASFGAVGMMKDSLLAGASCDVIILTQALIEQLSQGGEVLTPSIHVLGIVKTGIAVKIGDAAPAVGSPAELKIALQSARGIYFPDPVKATAGIHFMAVLKQLGLDTELAARLHPFPNGAAAMNAMAEAEGDGFLGCTQVTEILYTDGVKLVAPLPKEFELATVYTAAACTRAAEPEAANQLIALLVSPDAATVRTACGFE